MNCEYPPSEGSESSLLIGIDGSSKDPGRPSISQGRRSFQVNQPETSARPMLYAQQDVIQTQLADNIRTPESLPQSTFIRQNDGTQDMTSFCQPEVFQSLDEGPTGSSNVHMAFDAFLPDVENSVYRDNLAVPSSDFALMQPSFCTGGLDWLGVDIDDGSLGSHASPLENLDTAQFYFQREAEAEGTGSSRSEAAPRPMLGQAWTGLNRTDPRLQTVQQLTLPWPFDQTQESISQRYQLPPLRDVLGRNWRANRPAQATVLDGFIYILSDSRLPQLESLQESHCIQAFYELQRLVDLYFIRFHDIQAILHRPTWDISSCPTVFLAAMACVGALLPDSKADAEMSLALSEICSTIINWMVCLSRGNMLR